MIEGIMGASSSADGVTISSDALERVAVNGLMRQNGSRVDDECIRIVEPPEQDVIRQHRKCNRCAKGKEKRSTEIRGGRDVASVGIVKP